MRIRNEDASGKGSLGLGEVRVKKHTDGMVERKNTKPGPRSWTCVYGKMS